MTRKPRFLPLSKRLTYIYGKLACQQRLKKRLDRRLAVSLAATVTTGQNLAGLSVRLAVNWSQWGMLWLIWLVLAGLDRLYQKTLVADRQGSLPLSRFFRRLFEAQYAKKFLGANLAVFTLISTMWQPRLSVLPGTGDFEPVLPQPETVLTTETTFRQPVGGYLSQGYSWYHPGIDLAGNDNQIIYPIAEGTVIAVEQNSFGYGNSLIVSHNRSLASRYAHLSLIKVELSQSVDKNTPLGYVGSTGWSTGNHLHLEVYENGQSINPLAVLPDSD